MLPRCKVPHGYRVEFRFRCGFLWEGKKRMQTYRIRFWVAASLSLVVLLLVQGCSTVPVTGRRSLNLVSEGQEMQLGLSSFEEVKKETPISRDAAANTLVQRVGKRIAAVANKDMPNAQWEFVVFENPEANAF